MGTVCHSWPSQLSANGSLSVPILLHHLWYSYALPGLNSTSPNPFFPHPSSKVFFKGIYFIAKWQPRHYNWPKSFHLTRLKFSVVMCVNQIKWFSSPPFCRFPFAKTADLTDWQRLRYYSVWMCGFGRACCVWGGVCLCQVVVSTV